MNKEKVENIITSKWFHITLIILGTIFILLGAIHEEVWFDEAYTIALVRHDYSQIIQIDIGDVHPVLYYLLLKTFTLIFGNNILVCRLFSVVAGILMGVIGFTHIRKDFGPKVGLVYTFLAIFLPCMAVYGSEIRMYSWTMLFTTLSGIYAYRSIKQNKVKNWGLFALFSLAAAHSHYYGLVSVAIINGLLFLHIVFSKKLYEDKEKSKKKYIISFFITALIEIIGYLPWLPIFIKQATSVSQSYWIPLNLNDTVLAPLGVQFYGRMPIAVTVIYTVLMYAYLIYQIICLKKQKQNLSLIANCLLVHFILFFGMLAVTLLVKPIMYYRYMLITTGILIFPFSFFIANSKKKHQKIISCLVVIITLILSIYNNILFMKRNYDDSNKSEVEYVKQQYAKLEKEAKQQGNQDVIILYQDIFNATNIQVQMPEYNWYLYYIDPSHSEKAFENFRPDLKLTFDEEFLKNYKRKINYD